MKASAQPKRVVAVVLCDGRFVPTASAEPRAPKRVLLVYRQRALLSGFLGAAARHSEVICAANWVRIRSFSVNNWSPIASPRLTEQALFVGSDALRRTRHRRCYFCGRVLAKDILAGRAYCVSSVYSLELPAEPLVDADKVAVHFPGRFQKDNYRSSPTCSRTRSA